MKTYAYILGALLIGGVFAVDVSANGGKKSVMAPVTQTSKSMNAAGSVLSIDIIGNTITVEGGRKKKIQWVFSVPAVAKIMEGKKVISLGDITTGSKVSVHYTKDRDTLNASFIKVWPIKK